MEIAQHLARIETLVHDTRVLSGCLVIINDTLRVLAKAGNISLNPAERREVLNVFEGTGATQVRNSGMPLRGNVYKAIRCDKHAMYLQKDKAGMIIVYNKKHIVVGNYLDSMPPSLAVQAVESLATDIAKEPGT